MYTDPRPQQEDQSLDTTLRPLTFNEYVGQEKVKKNLNILIEAAKQRGEAIDHILLYGGSGLGKCVDKDSIVFSKKGMLPIGEFGSLTKKGFQKKQIEIYSNPGPQKTSHFYNNGKSKTIKIRTHQGYELEGTPNHPIIVLNKKGEKEFRQLKDIKKNDYAAIQRGQNYFGTKTELPGFNFQIKEMNKFDYSNYKMPNKMTPELARLCGYLIGDGYMGNKGGGKGVISFFSNEKEILGDFQKLWLKVFGQKTIIKKWKTKCPAIRVSNLKIRQFLTSIDLPFSVATTKKVPSSIVVAPKKIVKEFLSAYFECDAHIRPNCRQIDVSSASQKLIKQIRIILLNFGIISRIYEDFSKARGKSYWRLYITGEDVDIFKKEINFISSRKRNAQKDFKAKVNTNKDLVPYAREKIEKLKKQLVELRKHLDKKGYRESVRKQISHKEVYKCLRFIKEALNKIREKAKEVEKISDPTIFWDKIEKIEKGFAHTVDFSVPSGHTFFANGFINHNTTLAYIIARELGSNIKVTSGPAVEKVGDLAAILTNLQEGDVLFFDECLEGDTLISLEDGGVKKIKEIKNDDKVIGGKVTGFFKKKVDQIVKIISPYSILECSSNHPCIVSREGKIQKVLAKNLKLTDYLLTPLSLPHTVKNKITPKQARFLAMILTDGHVSKDLRTIQVEISKDKQYFQQVFTEGITDFGITPESLKAETKRKRKLTEIWSIKETKRGTLLLRTYSRELIKRLLSFGIPAGEKHHIIDVPKDIFFAPIESVGAFIDTCFCCEGWVTSDRRKKGIPPLQLCSTSPVFLQSLQLLLKKFGIFSYFRHIRKNSYRLEVTGNDALNFLENIGLTLKRKNKLPNLSYAPQPKTDLIPVPALLKQFAIIDKNFIRWRYTYFFRQNPGRYHHITRKKLKEIYDYIQKISFLESAFKKCLDYRYVPIHKIEKVKKRETVYDFTTTNHYFIANGMVTHNCHRLNKLIEEVLYPAMEEYKLDIIIGKGPSARTLQLKLPRFTLIAATTRAGMLSSPLRNRFGATYQLNFYSPEDIEQILKRSSRILDIKSETAGLRTISQRARFTPRVANRLLKRVRDYAQVKGQGIITEDIAKEALDMLEIDDMGLELADRNILKVIIEKFEGGPVGLDSIAAATSEEKDAISDIYEPYLMQIGFLARTSKGRITTKEAYKHLNIKKSQDTLV